MKPETASHSFEEIVQHLANKEQLDCPTRKLFGKILMKTVGWCQITYRNRHSHSLTLTLFR